jgi:adsorption protein B
MKDLLFNSHDLYLWGLLVLCFLYTWVGVEDVALDLIAVIRGLKPYRIRLSDLKNWVKTPEKRIAILVPAWKESKIISHMLLGNVARIHYDNYLFFVGCYPNDAETIEAVKTASIFNPKIIPVINSKGGPTSKGQMLNRILEEIQASPEKYRVDAFVLQDCEDIMDPWSLKLLNFKLDQFDFVQIPVFSLSVKPFDFVAGTYMDEFAESHTKDLLVRESLGAAIPSAGVGTAFSQTLAKAMIKQNGWVFYENSVTEDYELGIRSQALGFQGTFACYFFGNQRKRNGHYIATREYFPKKLGRAIRQKTRWTVGIAIQGWKNLGWLGRLSNRYYLYRDRRGLLTNILALIGYPVFIFLGAARLSQIWQEEPFLYSYGTLLTGLLAVNMALMMNRLWQRGRSVSIVYGGKALWLLPVRWPISVIVNSFACVNALTQTFILRIRKGTFQWVKTDHELPSGFGTAAVTQLATEPIESEAV